MNDVKYTLFKLFRASQGQGIYRTEDILSHQIYIYMCVCVCDFGFQNNHLTGQYYNLREKFSPGPGFEPGSPALHAGVITTKPPRQSRGPS